MEVLTRYKRKSVPNPLEIRGVSQSALETFVHVLPEELPHDFTDHVHEAISAYSPDEMRNGGKVASELMATAVEETHSLSITNTWTMSGGGESTGRSTDDRSSTCSAMSYDEFDREASAKVRLLFEEIDSVLFEKQSQNRGGADGGVADHIYSECGQWTAIFPHLRILGNQLMDTRDLGYESVCTPALSSESSTSSSGLEDVTDQDLHDIQSLAIEGQRLTPKTLDKCCTLGGSIDSIRHLEEEVFVQDGSYEEIIAIDHEAQDDGDNGVDGRRLHAVHRRHRSRYPPVTPNACVKDDVCSSAFDVIWAGANGAMRVLLQQYADSFVVPTVQHQHRRNGGGHGTLDTDDPSKRRAGVSEGGAFRFPQIVSLPSSRAEYSANHGISARPQGSLFVGGGVVRHPHLVGGVMGGGAGHPLAASVTVAETVKLDNILTISKKEMQAREKTFSEEPSGTGTPTAAMSWPGSLARKAGIATLHRNMSATTKKMVAAAGGGGGGGGGSRGRLAPLNDRVRTPNVEEEGLTRSNGQGLQGLHMAGKRISSPPLAASTARMLPPILQSEQLDMASSSMPQRMKRNNRAASALAEKDARLPRDKFAAAIVPDTRPSTTHTAFRVDTPNNNTASSSNKQSSTPVGVAAQFKGGSYPAAVEASGGFLGITGSSLVVPGRDGGDGGVAAALSSALELHPHHCLEQPDDEEEQYDEFVHHHYHHQHWGSPHAAANGVGGYRRGKTLSSFAR